MSQLGGPLPKIKPKAAKVKAPKVKKASTPKKKKKNWFTKDNNANLKRVLGAAENIAALGAGNPPSAEPVNGASNGAKDVATGEGKSTENGSANDNDTNYGGY